ncbi:MAG TPA: alkaline phosphatase, partial [Chryseosolibacter sp.]
DYLQKNPFESAYQLNIGYVEADVFLRGDKLMVAHTAAEIKPDRTLESLYLDKIKSKLHENEGSLFADASEKMTLMIDLKTEGVPTLNAIVQHLKKYPQLTTTNTLIVAISGNVPDTAQWRNYPMFITFDGRPYKEYSAKHLERISFISDNFRNYSSWNGQGEIPEADLEQLEAVIADVHSNGKKIRFWGAPDVQNCWELFRKLDVDILGTDKIEQISQHLRQSK